MSATRPLLVLHLRGSQVELGRQHAALLREAGGYQATADYYPRLAARMLRAGAHGTAERAAIRAIAPAIEAAVRRLDADRPEALRARSQAFFDELGAGAGLGRYVTIMDVFQNAVGLLGRIGLVPTIARLAAPACSTLVAWGDRTTDGRLLHARNFDFPGIGVWDAAPAVVFCTPDEGLRYGFLTTRGADVPGVTAFNEAGLCVTAHTRLHRDVALRGWSIVDLGHEIVRRARTIDQAVAIARERPSASTWGLAISSAAERTGVVVELTAGGTQTIGPARGEAFVSTSNLYAHPALRRGEIAPSAAWLHDCAGRASALRRHAARGGLDVESLWAMLGDHSDPDVAGHDRAGGGCVSAPYAVQSLVADLERGQIHVSVDPAPTGRGGWASLPVSWDAPSGFVEHHDRVDPGPRASRYAGSPAHARYVEAVRLEQTAAPRPEIAAALASAVALDPTEPSYRLLAGTAALAGGELDAGAAHLQVALDHEPNTFRRGQILLWALRGAQASGDRAAAAEHERRLLALSHPHLAAVQKAARADAPWTARRLARIALHPALVDASA